MPNFGPWTAYWELCYLFNLWIFFRSASSQFPLLNVVRRPVKILEWELFQTEFSDEDKAVICIEDCSVDELRCHNACHGNNTCIIGSGFWIYSITRFSMKVFKKLTLKKIVRRSPLFATKIARVLPTAHLVALIAPLLFVNVLILSLMKVNFGIPQFPITWNFKISKSARLTTRSFTIDVLLAVAWRTISAFNNVLEFMLRIFSRVRVRKKWRKVFVLDFL